METEYLHTVYKKEDIKKRKDSKDLFLNRTITYCEEEKITNFNQKEVLYEKLVTEYFEKNIRIEYIKVIGYLIKYKYKQQHFNGNTLSYSLIEPVFDKDKKDLEEIIRKENNSFKGLIVFYQ
ncbi:MAG: hypothetical protein QXU20_01660 [Candidatus Woesearchaeota archaeon]